MLSCLNKLWQPIDDALKRKANKADRNKDRNQVLGRKGRKMIKTAIGEIRSAKAKKEADSTTNNPKEARTNSVKEVRASRGIE